MKILAVNSSRRTGAGSKTELMLDRLAEGMRDAGGDGTVVNLEVWMDIMTCKADGQQLFLDKAYTVSGDLSLMLALFDRA